MSVFESPPQPETLLGYHRVLSPTAGVKVSPLALGGISIGSTWGEVFGKNEEPFSLLDSFYSLGGNFIDTSNTYNSEQSEILIGQWLEERGVRDQMVIATKYSASYRRHNVKNEPLQSNFIGNSAKSMHLSVRDSLKKLRTDYIDILYVHWWDFATSVEEVMRGLHAHVMAKEVLYLGASDTPAWVVVKANAFARANGLTPFSIYSGKWNASYRDMEGEIIPMCEDQGMAISPWASLGGGQLLSAEQRRQREQDPDAPKGYGDKLNTELCDTMELLAEKKSTTLQAIALAYLFHQSPYVFPVVGVNKVEHVKAMPDALRIKLSRDEVDEIHQASPYDPGFPMSFLYNFMGGQEYSLRLTPANNQQYKMGAYIDAPPKAQPYEPRVE